eukprot:gene12904-15158_t
MEINNTNSSVINNTSTRATSNASADVTQKEKATDVVVKSILNTDNIDQQMPSKKKKVPKAKPAMKSLSLNGRVIKFNPSSLKSFIDGEYEEYLDLIRSIFTSEEFIATRPSSDLRSIRQSASEKCRIFCQNVGLSRTDLHDGIKRMMSPSTVIGHSGDFSFGVKMGVHVWLYGGSLAKLGTAKHDQFLNPNYFKFFDIGCFCMTELGHGSNVRQLETTATYDHSKRSFTLTSPTPSSKKVFIGNSSEAQFAVVFARLVLPQEDGSIQDHGVHAFHIRIRDKDTRALIKGVFWEDCGPKMGVNGVDNGYLWFDNLIFPYDNLLDQYGSISEQGQYSSPVPESGLRFVAQLRALHYTRLAVSGSCIGACQLALSIALKYAFQRRQFGIPRQPEELLIHYSTHQGRLMPHLAGSVVMAIVQMKIEERWANVSDIDQREVETLISGFKAFATWESVACLQNARECCGGQGYLLQNRIALLRIDSDVMLTLEGDNTVLCQAVAKDLITEMKNKGSFKFFMNNISEEMPTFSRSAITSPEFQISVLKYRSSRLCRKVALRLRVKSRDHGAFAAWNMCLEHLIALAKSHMELKIVEIFHRAIQDRSNSDNREILELILSTYAFEHYHVNAKISPSTLQA